MILETLTGFGFWVIELMFQGVQLVSLPLNLTTVLLDFLKFGAWVIGADLLAIVWANILFWLTFKMAAGLVLFIYRLIPLT